ncbi:MAG: c-type cytochrome biogenesis protein CcsB [bacterium]
MNIILFKITLVVYFISTLHYLLFIYSRKSIIEHVALISTSIGFVVHSGAIVVRLIEAGHIPITNLYESLSFFAWAIILFFLIIQIRYKLGIIGSFVLPIVFLIIFYAAVLPNETKELLPALKSFWLGIHTTFAFLGYAAFTIAFILGIMYLIQQSQLKHKHQGPFYYRLPSLEVLDDLAYRCLSYGFPFFTFAIISGSLWASKAWGSYWQWDPKETWSLVTWFIYAALFHVRLVTQWRGRKVAYLQIIGFILMLFTYIGLNFFWGGLHVY